MFRCLLLLYFCGENTHIPFLLFPWFLFFLYIGVDGWFFADILDLFIVCLTSPLKLYHMIGGIGIDVYDVHELNECASLEFEVLVHRNDVRCHCD